MLLNQINNIKPYEVFKTELENLNLLSGKHLDEATVKNVAKRSEKICEFDEKTLKHNDNQDATARVIGCMGTCNKSTCSERVCTDPQILGHL